MHSSSAVVRLGAGLVLGFGLLAAAVPEAGAEIRAAGKKGLFTKVNGKTDGSCRSGICKISGGTSAGKNLFHRFRRFDTRGKIKGVEFDAIGKKNLIVGVTSSKGSFIDKSIGLNSSANLFWLSPGGIHLGQGASFVNVPNLTLSTANTLRFGSGSFDVFRSQASDLTGLTGQPQSGSLGLVVDPDSDAAGGVSRAGIYLDGIDIAIDESLYIDALDDALTVRSSSVSLDSSDKVGGSLTLTGQSVDLRGTTHLSATGAKGGGLIQVGGSWQNGDASVRQATTTSVGSDVVMDASAIELGDGGEIVVWSDITKAESVTDVSGSLLAVGGVNGGDGGRIETSGALLTFSQGVDVRANAIDGDPGLWLQDPYNYFITGEPAANIEGALNSGTDVTISTAVQNFEYGSGSASDEVGSIILDTTASIGKTAGAAVTLTLEADENINLRGTITSSSGALNVVAKAKGSVVVENVSGSSGGNQITTNGGDIVLWANTENIDSGTGDYTVRVDEGVNLSSGGGNIVLAGGQADDNNYPAGYAYFGNAPISESDTIYPGVSLGDPIIPSGPLITINSGGGDIVMRGRSGVANTAADGFGSQRDLSIISGTGTIEILGDQNSSGGGAGLRFGSPDYYPLVAISSESSESPAIRIVGSSVNRAGIWLGEGSSSGNPAGRVLIQSTATTGGGVRIEGSSSQSTSSSTSRAIALWGDTSGFSIPNVYQFLSNSGPIEFLSTTNSNSSQIGIWSDTHLGQPRDGTTSAVNGVTPIAGSSDVVTTFKADNWVSFMDDVYGSGSIEIAPFTAGQSVGVQSEAVAGDFWVENLDNLNGFSLVTVGDSSSTTGIQADVAVTLTTNTIFDAGSGGLTFAQLLDSSDQNVTFRVSGASSVAGLNLGDGSLTKDGPGALNLTSQNAYTGTTSIDGGTLQISDTGALGSSSSLTLNGGTLQVSVSATDGNSSFLIGGDGGVINVDSGVSVELGGIVSGSGPLSKQGAGTLQLAGVNTHTGSTAIDAGTLLVTGSLADASPVTVASGATYELGSNDTIASLSGAGAVSLSNYQLQTGADNTSTTFSGVISGEGQFTKLGTGQLTLSGANTYTGPTGITAGTLQVTGSLSDATPVTVAAESTYELGADDAVGSIAGSGSIALSSFELTSGGDNSSSTFSGVISGNGGLLKSGTGTLTLSGDNSYSGPTTMNGGTLQVSASAALGNSTALAFDGGTLQISSAVTGATGNVALSSGGGVVAVDAGQTFVYSGIVSGGGSLTKQGDGVLELSGANTYSGATAVTAGTLQVTGTLADATAVTVSQSATYSLGADDTIGSLAGGGSVQLSNYQLQAGGDNTSTTFSGVISGTGGLTKSGTGELNLSGENTYTGATTVQNGSIHIQAPSNTSGLSSSTALTVESGGLFKAESGGTTNVGSLAGAGTVEIVSANDVFEVGADNSSTTFSGLLTGAGGLAKVGTGSINLTNSANDFGSGRGNQQPAVLISGGSLTVDSDGALGTAVGDGSILIENGAVLGFKGSTTLNSERGIEFGTSGGKIEVDPEFTVVIPSNLSGTYDFEKLGTGTLQLTGENPAFTGTTTVSGGTLTVTGANPTTATCANSASSNLCVSAFSGQSPTPTETEDTDETTNELVESDDTALTTPTPTPDDNAPTPTPADDAPTPSPDDNAPTPTPADDELTPTPDDTELTPTPDDTDSTPEPTPDPDLEDEPNNETAETLEDSGVDEDTAVAVVQRVDDPSITTVSTPDADSAATPSPAATSDTGSSTSSESEAATASGSSSSIPSSLSADGVAVELTMESSFSMTSSGDDAPSSAAPAAATAGDGGGEASAATTTESATTESSTDASSESSAEGGDEAGSDTQETQADGDGGDGDGDGADDGEGDGSGDGDDASDTTTTESDQPRSPAVAVTRVSAEQASRNLQNGDAVSTQRAVQGLNLPELSGRSTPSVQSISGFLQQLRQQVANP